MKTFNKTLAVSVITSVLLSACGGGGGSSTGATGSGNGNQTTEEKRRPESVIYLSGDKKRLFAAPDDGAVEAKTLSGVVFNKIGDFKVSPDGEYVAYTADQEIAGQFDLYVAEIDGDEAVKVSQQVQIFSDVRDFAWSPGSEQLAYRTDDAQRDRPSLYVVNVDGSNLYEAANLSAYANSVYVKEDYAWSPDGHFLAWLLPYEFNSDRNISIWSLDTRTQAQATSMNIVYEVPLSFQLTREIDSFKWSPDSQQIAFRSDILMNNNDQYGIVVAPATATGLIRKANGSAVNKVQIDEYQWSPDSQYLAQGIVQFPQDDVQVGINSFHLASSLSTRLISTPVFGDLRWAHNSNRLAFVANYDTDVMLPSAQPELIIYDVDGSLIDDINHDLAPKETLSDDDYFWSPDDSLLLYIAERDFSEYAYLVSTDDSGEASQLGSTMGYSVDSLSFSPDGQKLAFLAMDEGGAFHPGNWYVFDSQGNELWVSDDLFTYNSTQKIKWASDMQKLVYSAASTVHLSDELVSIDLETFSNLIVTDDSTIDVAFDYAEESLLEEEDVVE